MRRIWAGISAGAMRILPTLLGTILFFISGCNQSPAQSGITKIWAVDDGEKVRQDDLNHWAATSPLNRVWDGTTIRVFAARNEVVAFQVILEAGGVGASEVDVRLDTLRNGTATIANQTADPFATVGRYIDLFVVHYQQVTGRSPFGGANGSSESRALPDAEMQGWIPDGLVPIEAPVKRPAHGQGGSPFDIQAGRNQAVWVDVYVPKGAPAGTYRGFVRITQLGTLTSSIPFELQVYPFVLPDETHQKNMFCWNLHYLPNRYGITLDSPAYWAMFRKFMHWAHRHRLNLVDGWRTLNGANSFSTNLAGYFTGKEYTRSAGYEGPGEGVGERTYPIGMYDQPNNGWASGFYPNDASSWQRAADAWEQWFRTNAPEVLRFKYMDDEPDMQNPSVVDLIRQKCEWITSSPGVGKNLHRFVTREYVYGGLFGAIDFWALSGDPGIQVNVMQDRKQNHGELFCMYNGTRPMWGQMEILDNHATDNRVNPWIQWKYGVDLVFLWETSYYAENLPPHPAAVNVWQNNYINSDPKAWGSGMWFYPGRDVTFPEDDRGLDGPVGSIRMKNFRRGQQDAEYLWLARQAGLATDSIVNQVVPRALDDWGSSSYTDPPGIRQQPVFATKGYIFEQARRALAERLAGSGGTGTVPSGTFQVTPAELPPGGGRASLIWTSSGATAASIDHSVGTVALAGTREVSVLETTTFSLTLTNQFGHSDLQTTVTVRESVVVEPPPTGDNAITNGTFEMGTSPWIAYSNGQIHFTSTAPGSGSTRAGKVSLAAWGDNTQVYQEGVTLDPHALYRLTFDARADSARDMDIGLIKHTTPFTSYGMWAKYVNLHREWGSYSLEFDTQALGQRVTDGRFMFRIGPYAKAGDVYWLDNIVLRKIRNLPATTSIPKDYQMGLVYPNPFNPFTNIPYSLPKEAHVHLAVYDMLGREVAVLVNDLQIAGRYVAQLDGSALASGFYFCTLIAGAFVETQRLLLLR
jgi:hypothetical protein